MLTSFIKIAKVALSNSERRTKVMNIISTTAFYNFFNFYFYFFGLGKGDFVVQEKGYGFSS